MQNSCTVYIARYSLYAVHFMFDIVRSTVNTVCRFCVTKLYLNYMKNAYCLETMSHKFTCESVSKRDVLKPSNRNETKKVKKRLQAASTQPQNVVPKQLFSRFLIFAA